MRLLGLLAAISLLVSCRGEGTFAEQARGAAAAGAVGLLVG